MEKEHLAPANKNGDLLLSHEDHDILAFIQDQDEAEDFNPFQEIDDYLGLGEEDKK